MFGCIAVADVVWGGWDEVSAQCWHCSSGAKDVLPVKEGTFGGWVEVDLRSRVRGMFGHEGYNWQ